MSEFENVPTVTIRDQAGADSLIPSALANGPIHLRIEPIEGAIDLPFNEGVWCHQCDKEIAAASVKHDGSCGWCGGELSPMPQGILSVAVSGGEKPVHPQWVRDLRDQCKAAGVAFVFLGWGDWAGSGPDFNFSGIPANSIGPSRARWVHPDGRIYLVGKGRDPEGALLMLRIGRERTGRTLDGRVHGGGG